MGRRCFFRRHLWLSHWRWSRRLHLFPDASKGHPAMDRGTKRSFRIRTCPHPLTIHSHSTSSFCAPPTWSVLEVSTNAWICSSLAIDMAAGRNICPPNLAAVSLNCIHSRRMTFRHLALASVLGFHLLRPRSQHSTIFPPPSSHHLKFSHGAVALLWQILMVIALSSCRNEHPSNLPTKPSSTASLN